MPGSDPYSPITTSRQLDQPTGYRIYSTTRLVPTEFPIPAKGAVLSASNFIGGFGTDLAPHYILDVTDAPHGTGKRVTVTHGPLPSAEGGYTEYESVAHTFPPIYPNNTAFFPGGSKARPRVVPAKVVYEYSLDPSASGWLSAATIWDFSSRTTGPFEVQSYLSEAAGTNFTDGDGDSGLVGDFMNPSFIGQDTINNAFTIYAPGDLFFAVTASAPSATTYASWVAAGSEIMKSRTIHRWYCFYMRRTVWIKAQ